jgi:hypothetical protein
MMKTTNLLHLFCFLSSPRQACTCLAFMCCWQRTFLWRKDGEKTIMNVFGFFVGIIQSRQSAELFLHSSELGIPHPPPPSEYASPGT